MPSDSSDVHCCTWAFWAAWVRLALDWLRAEVRSYELSWVTAALEVAAGCPTCGRITVARTTLQTTTALSSGITLTLLLESPYPWGAVQACGLKEDVWKAAQEPGKAV